MLPHREDSECSDFLNKSGLILMACGLTENFAFKYLMELDGAGLPVLLTQAKHFFEG